MEAAPVPNSQHLKLRLDDFPSYTDELLWTIQEVGELIRRIGDIHGFIVIKEYPVGAGGVKIDWIWASHGNGNPIVAAFEIEGQNAQQESIINDLNRFALLNVDHEHKYIVTYGRRYQYVPNQQNQFVNLNQYADLDDRNDEIDGWIGQAASLLRHADYFDEPAKLWGIARELQNQL